MNYLCSTVETIQKHNVNHLNFSYHTFDVFKIWTHLNRSCWQTWPNNPPIRFMHSFTGQGQLGKLYKLFTFAFQKRIYENPNCVLWPSNREFLLVPFCQFMRVRFYFILVLQYFQESKSWFDLVATTNQSQSQNQTMEAFLIWC